MIAIVLYLIFLTGYLLWERSVKRERNAAKKPAFNPFKSSPKEDIMGKSGFDLRHSLPQATMLIKSEKREENAPIFADGNDKTVEQNAPVTIPPSELDRVFSSDKTADDSDEIDLIIDDKPEGEFEPEDDGDVIDTDESEEAGGLSGVSMATGVNFDDLSGMVKTVDNPEAATPDEKEEAGRVLVEVRKTDMFEQVVSGEPKKKVTAGKLMDDYFAAYHRRKRNETTDEPSVKAPKDFDPRAFT
jgi:hypothetical protein